jgi:solute carrier family 25 (mitochondrial folate transporter), member 32
LSYWACGLDIVPLYDNFKWRWKQSFPEANNAVVHMGSAVSAGAIADILCNPMFVVRTRLQTEAVHNLARGEVFKSSSIVQTIQQLYAEGGLRTFWRGMSANLLGLSHVAVQFPVYEQLKFTLRQRRRRHLHESGSSHNTDAATTETVLDLLLASGLSKVFASLLTYPHETIRSRMMDARTAHAVSFIGTCRSIYRTEGVLGFYAGLSISLIRVIPNTMLTFLVYETTLRLVQNKLLPGEVSKQE